VYNIPCLGCPNVYVGETTQLLRSRVYKHKRDVQNLKNQNPSLLSCPQNGTCLRLCGDSIDGWEENTKNRKTLEVVKIFKKGNIINFNYLPNVYSRLTLIHKYYISVNMSCIAVLRRSLIFNGHHSVRPFRRSRGRTPVSGWNIGGKSSCSSSHDWCVLLSLAALCVLFSTLWPSSSWQYSHRQERPSASGWQRRQQTRLLEQTYDRTSQTQMHSHVAYHFRAPESAQAVCGPKMGLDEISPCESLTHRFSVRTYASAGELPSSEPGFHRNNESWFRTC
jgi:hypothetical protein